MTLDEGHQFLHHIARRYRLIKITEAFLISLSVSVLTFSIAFSFEALRPFGIVLAIPGLVITLFIAIKKQKLFQINPHSISQILNNNYAIVDASADLILADSNTISDIVLLQQYRTLSKLKLLPSPPALPHQTGQAALVFAGTCIAAVITVMMSGSRNTINLAGLPKISSHISIVAPPSITKTNIEVKPPRYTRLPSAIYGKFDLTLVENSEVRWSIRFSENVNKAFLLFSGNDTLSLQSRDAQTWAGSRTFDASGLYQIGWYNHEGTTKISNFFKIEVTRDAPPEISVTQPTPYTTIKFATTMTVPVKSTIRDDYGISEAHITATVSKGSGESVKFRELQIAFDQQVSGRIVNATRVLDLSSLKMEPGDELYLYIEASDNRAPVPGKSRTETYFINIQDTTHETSAFDSGMGVDVMPEYFRSQRQIIIDTEKLLAEHNQITRTSFNQKSNDLGSDQKTLRLRYGQFMGEESETPGDGDGDGSDPVKEFGHVHDTENEAGQVPAKVKEADQSKQLTHEHEDGEQAALFERSIKAKLNAALSMMWDAELHLRMSEPKKSLPFQYRILKLLKEISNDSRIYVRRTGFEPPPVKEDKRLKGDLAEIANSSNAYSYSQPLQYVSIRKAIPLLSEMLQHPDLPLTSEWKKVLKSAGDELAVVAIKQPGIYLESLNTINKITNGWANENGKLSMIGKLYSHLSKLVPLTPENPNKRDVGIHPLTKIFINNIIPVK